MITAYRGYLTLCFGFFGVDFLSMCVVLVVFFGFCCFFWLVGWGFFFFWFVCLGVFVWGFFCVCVVLVGWFWWAFLFGCGCLGFCCCWVLFGVVFFFGGGGFVFVLRERKLGKNVLGL